MAARFARIIFCEARENPEGEKPLDERQCAARRKRRPGPSNFLFLVFKAGRYGASRFFLFPLIPEVTFLRSILFQRSSNCSLFPKLVRFTPRRPRFLRGAQKSIFTIFADEPGACGKFAC